jgi:hypothetical protein
MGAVYALPLSPTPGDPPVVNVTNICDDVYQREFL